MLSSTALIPASELSKVQELHQAIEAGEVSRAKQALEKFSKELRGLYLNHHEYEGFTPMGRAHWRIHNATKREAMEKLLKNYGAKNSIKPKQLPKLTRVETEMLGGNVDDALVALQLHSSDSATEKKSGGLFQSTTVKTLEISQTNLLSDYCRFAILAALLHQTKMLARLYALGVTRERMLTELGKKPVQEFFARLLRKCRLVSKQSLGVIDLPKEIRECLNRSVQIADSSGCTALTYALKVGEDHIAHNLSGAMQLLNEDADLKKIAWAQDGEKKVATKETKTPGKTPLIITSDDINAFDRDGMTFPMRLVAQQKMVALEEIFSQKGIRINLDCEKQGTHFRLIEMAICHLPLSGPLHQMSDQIAVLIFRKMRGSCVYDRYEPMLRGIFPRIQDAQDENLQNKFLRFCDVLKESAFKSEAEMAFKSKTKLEGSTASYLQSPLAVQISEGRFRDAARELAESDVPLPAAMARDGTLFDSKDELGVLYPTLRSGSLTAVKKLLPAVDLVKPTDGAPPLFDCMMLPADVNADEFAIFQLVFTTIIQRCRKDLISFEAVIRGQLFEKFEISNRMQSFVERNFRFVEERNAQKEILHWLLNLSGPDQIISQWVATYIVEVIAVDEQFFKSKPAQDLIAQARAIANRGKPPAPSSIAEVDRASARAGLASNGAHQFAAVSIAPIPGPPTASVVLEKRSGGKPAF